MGWTSALLLTLAAATAQTPATVRDWREDIAIARRDFLAKDLSFSSTHRALAARRLDRLSRDVPRLSDQEIVAELARVAALADNAHTRAYLLRNRGWWRRYPIRVWRFADGWRVVATRPAQEAMLGARLTAIGGVPVDRAQRAVRPLFAGTDNWAGYMASYSLTSPDALLGAHVIKGSGATDLSLERDGRRFTMRVEPAVEPRRSVPEEAWWFLSPAHAAVDGWRQVLGRASLPPYLAQPDRWYALRRCAGDILYMPFFRAEDQPGREDLATFTGTVLAAVERSPTSKLVIDLRFNTGGNLLKTWPFFTALTKSAIGQNRGRLFVILGPNTFSAGISPAALLKEESKAIFAGTEPGDRLWFWAEGGNVTLPHSGINLHYADRAHLYGVGGPSVPDNLVLLRQNARPLTPDLPAAPTFADYMAGRDVVTERIAPGGLRCEAATSAP